MYCIVLPHALLCCPIPCCAVLCGVVLCCAGQVLLESQPEAAGVEDASGRMALHVAVDKHQPWLRLVDTLVAAYPTACKMRDGERICGVGQ